MSKKYYISTGSHSIYYTLRFTQEVAIPMPNAWDGGVEVEMEEKDYFVKNLSTNKEVAIRSAKSYVEKHNDGVLLTVSADLIVTGKIGDAKSEQREKSEFCGHEAMPIPASSVKRNESTVYRKEHKHPTVWEWYNWQDLQKAGQMYSHKIWQDIRKTFLQDVYSDACQRSDSWTICKFRTHLRKYLQRSYDSYLQSSFILDMYVSMFHKQLIKGRALQIVADIYAKKYGRRNSKIYEEVYQKVLDTEVAHA